MSTAKKRKEKNNSDALKAATKQQAACTLTLCVHANLLIHDVGTTVGMCVKQKLGRTTEVCFQLSRGHFKPARTWSSREGWNPHFTDVCRDFQDV